ncbi:hypothetical protein Ddc_12729 [Ditylenchus destructor]|nr:hypothetical protein Ddc_12729 [Ditylenchus destructor]
MGIGESAENDEEPGQVPWLRCDSDKVTSAESKTRDAVAGIALIHLFMASATQKLFFSATMRRLSAKPNPAKHGLPLSDEEELKNAFFAAQSGGIVSVSDFRSLQAGHNFSW